MNGVLIDDKGRCWPDSGDLARWIAYDGSRTDLSTFAVCELGFIHLGQRQGIARVSVREHRFNLVTLMGAILELGRMNPAHIILRVCGDASTEFYSFVELRDFAAQTRPLASGLPLEISLPRLAEPRNLRILNLRPFKGARPIVDLWRQTRGELSEDIGSALISGGVLNRMILARQRRKCERLVVEEFGSAIKFVRANEIIGRDIADMPDRDYGAWTAESYTRFTS